jgi:1-deoxy-D-xylulose-5-phosphate reductoisomerase
LGRFGRLARNHGGAECTNEIAVAAFLESRIRFDQIHLVNQATLSGLSVSPPVSLAEILALDEEARAYAQQRIRGLAR